MPQSSEAFVSPAPAASSPRPRYKVELGLLAALGGWFGAHWWYVGRRGAWAVTAYAVLCLAAASRFPVWYDNPAFFLLFIPMTDGLIEALVFCLINDEKFDRLYNAGRNYRTQSGWAVVIVAIFSTLLGGVATMGAIAMVVVYVWTAMGWLDGFVL